MVAVDTNVIVRFLTHDDPSQTARAVALFRSERIYIPKTVLLETEWVLRSLFGFDAAAVNRALADLIALPNVQVEHPTAVGAALRLTADGLDFADSLHVTSAAPADAFVTFDAKSRRRALRAGVEHVREL
jgi:predicted nucleic-acid-binding protein